MQIKPTQRRGTAGGGEEAGETSSKGDVCKVAGCMLLAGWLAAVEVNYSPVILLIATICSLELLQIDDNVSGESKQMMSPTEKIVCWRNRWASCCICWNRLELVSSFTSDPSKGLHCCWWKALNSHAQICLAHAEKERKIKWFINCSR